MPFVPKDWRDATTYAGGGDTSTPLTAATLEDLEIRVTDYAEEYANSVVSDPPATVSAMLYGFADDEDNHQDFYADALATGCNSARIGVGYNAPGSAASLAAVAAYEADDQIDQVVVYLWSVSVISAATWATQAALACAQYPNALIELLNEPNLISFGGYTWQQAADATIAAVNACPSGRIIGPAVSQIGESNGGDYIGYMELMYDRIFDSVDPADMAGVSFHLYPTTADPGAELESHVDACYAAGLGAPVFITELGLQYGIYNIYQGWSSAATFDTYYNDDRVGGIYYYRLAPQQPTPLEGETFQRYPLTTNPDLEASLTDAFTTPPVTTGSSAVDIVGGSFSYTTIFSAESFLSDAMPSGYPHGVGSLVSDETNTNLRPAVASEALALNVDHQSASSILPLHPVSVFPFVAADYAMALGGSLRLRFRVVVMGNATDPNCDFSVTLFAAHSGGSSDLISITTPGSVLGTATLANADLAASDQTTDTSASFEAPADCMMQFLVTPSATVASGFAGSVHCYLQLAHIL